MIQALRAALAQDLAALESVAAMARDEVGSAKALEEELGLDPPALERRLIRWLEELGK